MSWTPETLKDYVDREFVCQRDNVAHALDAAKTALAKSEHDLQIWKASQNEWRSTVSDLVTSTLTRREWEVAHQVLQRELEQQRRLLESHLANALGARLAAARLLTISGVVAAVFGTLSGAGVAILHYLNSRP